MRTTELPPATFDRQPSIFSTSIIANTPWEREALHRHTTVVDVEAHMARCQHGRDVAPTRTRKNEWQRKLEFLLRLRTRLSHRS